MFLLLTIYLGTILCPYEVISIPHGSKVLSLTRWSGINPFRNERSRRQIASEFWTPPQNNQFGSNFNGFLQNQNDEEAGNDGGFNFWDDDDNSVSPPARFDNNDLRNTPEIPPWLFARPSSTRRTPTSTPAIPGMGTTRSACEDTCPATPQFDPVCGTNMVTYTNMQRLRCAQRCGKNVEVKYRRACPRTSSNLNRS